MLGCFHAKMMLIILKVAVKNKIKTMAIVLHLGRGKPDDTTFEVCISEDGNVQYTTCALIRQRKGMAPPAIGEAISGFTAAGGNLDQGIVTNVSVVTPHTTVGVERQD